MDREHYRSYLREEANHEIARLEIILHRLGITEEERKIAQAMLDFYQEAKHKNNLDGTYGTEPGSVVPLTKQRTLKCNSLSAHDRTPRKKMRAA